MRATERNPDFAEEAWALLPASGPLVVACDTGGYLEVTVEKKRNGKVVKSFKDKERVFGWESRSLKACHELRMSGFSDIYHPGGGGDLEIRRVPLGAVGRGAGSGGDA